MATELRCHATVKRRVKVGLPSKNGTRQKSEDQYITHDEKCDMVLVYCPHPERPFWWCKKEKGGCGRMWTKVAIEAANPGVAL